MSYSEGIKICAKWLRPNPVCIGEQSICQAIVINKRMLKFIIKWFDFKLSII